MPREIRDRVYHYFQEPELTVGTLNAYTRYKDMIPHWYCPTFVGLDFARECAQIHYEETTFLLDEINLTGVYGSLAADHYGLDIDPMTFIRSCRVDFSTDHVPCGIISDELLSCGTAAAELLSLKHRSTMVEFVIDLAVCGEVQRLLVLTTSLEPLQLLLQQFKAQQLAFRVLTRTATDEPRKDWREITDLWDLAPEILLAKVRTWHKCLGTFELLSNYMTLRS
jgi:hypothetical protein